MWSGLCDQGIHTPPPGGLHVPQVIEMRALGLCYFRASLQFRVWPLSNLSPNPLSLHCLDGNILFPPQILRLGSPWRPCPSPRTQVPKSYPFLSTAGLSPRLVSWHPQHLEWACRDLEPSSTESSAGRPGSCLSSLHSEHMSRVT